MASNGERSFSDSADAIVKKYGHLFDFTSKEHEDVVMDIIELWEDTSRALPLLDGIVHGTLSDEQFKKALLTLWAWSRHTSDHLRSLEAGLEE